jgi:hypothetical protein
LKFKNILNKLPDHPLVNACIVYATSVYFHKSFLFYFSRSLNGYILRNKPSSDFLAKYVDKITAKEYIQEKVGVDHVVEMLGQYDGSIPERSQWVFKCNSDFSGALLYFDEKIIDVKKIVYQDPVKVNSKRELAKYLEYFIDGNNKGSPFGITREGCYKSIKKQFFFEALIPHRNLANLPVNEYKFHCLNGRVEFVYLVYDRTGINKRIILDRDKKILPFSWCKPRDLQKFKFGIEPMELSKNFHLMLELAEKLSADFPYVRVDIYDTHPHPKVGELTFFHGSGLEPITPKAFDYEYGSKL